MRVLGFQDKLLLQVSYLYPMYFINSLLLANKAKFGLFNVVGLNGQNGTLVEHSYPPPPPNCYPSIFMPFAVVLGERHFEKKRKDIAKVEFL